MDYREEETIINNEYDYSNILPTIENITYIIEYCNQIYDYFLKLIEEDENKNEKLKYEYKNYNYKKSFNDCFEIIIKQKNFSIISCNYNSFIESVKNNQLSNIAGLEINLNLSYKRGKSDNMNRHENSFNISFKPYDIKFIRKSNYKETDMEQIENNLNEMLKKFPIANTIFCSK